MKKKIFLAVFLCCGMFAAMAQTAADSLAIVSADWQTEPLQKGMLYKKAVFSSLYGVPQEVSIFEISPEALPFRCARPQSQGGDQCSRPACRCGGGHQWLLF